MTNQTIDDAVRYWEPSRNQVAAKRLLDYSIDIQQIPAPTFDEVKRALFIEEKFHSLNLKNIQRDDLHNVTGWLTLSDESDAPIFLITAHSDTVFPANTDLTVRRENDRLYGPGIGDNSLGVGVVLMLAEMLSHAQRDWPISIGFVINSREEGLGNLDGIRKVIDRLPAEKIGGVLVLEGMALGRIYHAGIAVRRLRIKAKSSGGHSWLHFGEPSAIHTLVQLAAEISQLEMPSDPRTTYNIGLIEGGHSINSIATDATLSLDMRSTTMQGLQWLERHIGQIVSKYGDAVSVEVIGNRPAGSLASDHPLVQIAEAAYQHVGLKPTLENGSTDANYILSKGIPAVVVGVTYGGNAHRTDEYIETRPLADGFYSILLMVDSMIHHIATVSSIARGS